ncbi:MAG: AAA family ATPase [Opitutales bacterium]|nr:AAA family ATPase [Opitutales bacterium]
MIESPYALPALVILCAFVYIASIWCLFAYGAARRRLHVAYRLKTAEAELVECEAVLERTRTELAEARSAVEMARTEEGEALRNREAADSRAADLEKGFEKQRKEFENRLGRLRSEEQNLEEAVLLLRRERREEEENRARRDSLKREVAALEARKGKAESALEAVEREIRSIEGRKRDLAAEVEALDDLLKNKRQQQDHYDVVLRELAARMEHFESNLKPPALRDRLQDFERPVLAAVREGAAVPTNEQAAVEACVEMLSEAGFVFHERSVYAFHTSLKTTRYSPMVILSGISGTGKSQLPRLYSAAMGLHFMNVAVQPRWDSPQDLFGFYNYMEKRYKATELARALRQMDAAHYPAPEADPAARAVQRGVLMVLLDEMNLARVEYYFSELLSKLEMRGKGLAGDADRRGLASIEIECGALEAEEKTVPLLVDQNVLFVGTMNEDESTLSLSDKVMDRANVLRFGKPGRLTLPAENGGVPGRRRSMDFETWRSWITDPDPADEDIRELDGIIERLNGEMDKVGRPFGFRTSLSMRHYVANYPGWVRDRFQWAMADILEQKVLPRLRGLSNDGDRQTADALEEIGAVVRGTGDDPLTQAFEEAKASPIFEFKGVRREAGARP